MSETGRLLVPTALGRVHCLVAGPAEGLPVVLLHQTPRSVDEFAGVLPLLAGTRRVIAVDAPGYGCSDRPDRQPTVAEYAAVVGEVLDACGAPRAGVVGHHTGAVVGVELAASEPERVAGLVLSGPIYIDAETRAMLGAVFGQWRVRADGSHLAEKWEKFAGWTEDPDIVQRAVVDLVRAGETSEFGHFAVAEYRMEERLGLVRCPVLLVFGRRDPFRVEGGDAPFRAALGGCRSIELDGGVFLPEECPDELARAVLEFL